MTAEDVVAGIATRATWRSWTTPAGRPSWRDPRLLATHPDTRGRDVLELPYVTRAYRLIRLTGSSSSSRLPTGSLT